MYGNLTVFTGPMFCGKTTSLLKNYVWAHHLGAQVSLFKPSFDDRYSITKITTHSGLSADAINVAKEEDVVKEAFVSDVLFFDEIQFFEEPRYHGDLPALIKTLLKEGKTIYASGLDMDWRGEPFLVTSKLLAMADKVEKMTSICSVTGKAASKTYKKSLSGESVELGHSDKYEARSNEAWQAS